MSCNPKKCKERIFRSKGNNSQYNPVFDISQCRSLVYWGLRSSGTYLYSPYMAVPPPGTNPYISDVTQHCRCSPILIFRTWATSVESNKTRLLHMCFMKSKLRLGQDAQWQLFSQAFMFNMFTALDGVLLEEGYVVFVSGL